jgi:hypothetical protein
MFNAQYGILNHALRALGFAAGNENWRDDPTLALPAILLTTVWQIFPFASVVLLAALQGVSAGHRPLSCSPALCAVVSALKDIYPDPNRESWHGFVFSRNL